MKIMLIAKPRVVFIITVGSTILLVLLISSPRTRTQTQTQSFSSSPKPNPMARSFVLWLHGLGDSGPANEPIKTLFTSPQFRNAVWSFPSAPSNPVSCNYGAVMPSWFDIHEIPITPESPKDESGVLKAVQNVHAMIDKEVAAGVDPKNVFVCGFSQGGALTLASVLLYPKTLGGGTVFSGWVPFNSSIIERITPDAKKVIIEIIGALLNTKAMWDFHLVKVRLVPQVLSSRMRHTASMVLIWGVALWADSKPKDGFKAYLTRKFFNGSTPILWSHGIADRTVLFEAGQAGPPFLEQAGLTCEFKAYPGLGHSISNEELRNLESWIKTRMTSSS